MSEMGNAQTADIPQLDPFQVAPKPLAGIQLWGIGGEPFEMETLCGSIGQERFDNLTTVNGGTVPDDDHPAWDFTQQVLQEGDHICRVKRAVLAVEIELALRGDGTDGREMITGAPLPQDGRLAHRGIGPDDTRQGVEPRFIYKEDGLALGFCPFLMARQVSSRQCAMAASSRCRARRAGFCGLQRITASRRPT
jgi:hypothetical protein